MHHLLKIFVSFLLLATTAHAQAQGMIKKGSCKAAAVGAKNIVNDFYNSGKSDFSVYLSEERRKNEKSTANARSSASSGGEMLAIAGLGALTNSSFNKSIRILGALDFSRTEHFYPYNRRLTEYIILEIEARGYQYCLNYM